MANRPTLPDPTSGHGEQRDSALAWAPSAS
jgi:hypothetical protein